MSAMGVRSVLVLGGTSEIGLAITGALVRRGASSLVLAGRDPDRLAEAAKTLTTATVSVACIDFDATEPHQHRKTIDEAVSLVGDVDVVVVAVGVLADESGIDADPVAIAEVVATNMGGAMGVMAAAAARLRRQGHGTIVVLSSVAGFLVRPDNPIYGASKSGLDAYACALGELLRPDGVHVVVVRPGFVRTSMTAGMADRPMATTASAVADEVLSGMDRGARVVWVPRTVGIVMPALRLLPQRIRGPLLRRSLAKGDHPAPRSLDDT